MGGLLDLTTDATLKEDSKTSWGNVESSYQRMNLIGNLVNTVSGAANLRSLH
jgi:hypothetical protein